MALAILPIVLEGEEVLRQVAAPVPKISKKTQKLVKDMIDTMYAADGAGLAAPQVGVSQRIFVVDVGDGPVVMINPRILSQSGEEIDVEGCLSIPGYAGYVKRALDLTIEGYDEKGKFYRLDAHGFFARAIQHEMDHLDGILFTDKTIELETTDGEEKHEGFEVKQTDDREIKDEEIKDGETRDKETIDETKDK